MTIQHFQENINKTGVLESLLSSTVLPEHNCFRASGVFIAAITAKERTEKRDPSFLLANHAIDLKQLTHALIISNHRMTEKSFVGGRLLMKIFQQLAICVYIIKHTQILRKQVNILIISLIIQFCTVVEYKMIKRKEIIFWMSQKNCHCKVFVIKMSISR